MDWILFGFLLFSLLVFTTTFIYNNNPDAISDDEYTKFDNYSNEIESNLILVESDTDSLLINVTSKTNPEASQLGSSDSVAVSYGITGSAKSVFVNSKELIGWVFSGEVGEILLGVFGGLFGLVSLYFITKWIRNGL